MVFKIEDNQIIKQLQSKGDRKKEEVREPIITFSLRLEEGLNQLIIDKARACNLSKQAYIHQILLNAVELGINISESFNQG